MFEYLKANRSFRISSCDSTSSSSRYSLGGVTLSLNFEGIISISWYARYDLTAARRWILLLTARFCFHSNDMNASTN